MTLAGCCDDGLGIVATGITACGVAGRMPADGAELLLQLTSPKCKLYKASAFLEI